MRFCQEADLRQQLEAVGFTWLECRRFKVESPALDFNQLRVRVRK
jgi:hypothetical protein